MIKIIALSAFSALAGSGATLQAISTSTAVADKCRLYGYTQCVVIDGAELPSTTDQKLRAEMTRHVRQMVRDRSRG